MAPISKSLLYIGAFFAVLGIVCSQNLNGNVYVEKQLLCALDRAPCDNLGKQIKASDILAELKGPVGGKEALPEIIGKNCKSCDRKQLANAKGIARFVQSKYPNVWNELVRKYGSPAN